MKNKFQKFYTKHQDKIELTKGYLVIPVFLFLFYYSFPVGKWFNFFYDWVIPLSPFVFFYTLWFICIVHLHRKDRKHLGRYTPKIIKPKTKYDEIKKDAMEPREEYDGWNDRDGLRDYESHKRRQKDRKKFPYKKGGRRRTQK